MLFKRANCAYRLDDPSGNTYDSKGKVCGGLSDDDKMWIGIAGGLCGLVLLGLGITYLIRRRRSIRARQREMEEMQQSNHYSTPLLGGWAGQMMGHRNNTASGPTSNASAYAHHMSSAPAFSPPMSSPSSLGSSGSGPGSPYSPNSETFHFPILSADGHLLPPAPASVSASPSLSFGHGNGGGSARLVSPVITERPLPSPPMETTLTVPVSMSIVPTPNNPRRQSRPISTGGGGTGYAPVPIVGLWPEDDTSSHGHGDIGQLNMRSSGYSNLADIRTGARSPTSVNTATPRFSPGLPYLQPQSATVYRSHSYEDAAGYR